MQTPQAKHPSAPSAKQTTAAPPASNAVRTDVDVAYINGKAHPIIKGETMLQFLRRHLGPNPVPTLCDAPNLEPFGSCRVCSVEVQMAVPARDSGSGPGMTDQVELTPPKVMASCHTPIGKGMYLTTNSPRMERLRKNIVELVLTDYDRERLKTEDHGANELYNVVQQIGFDIDSVRYPEGRRPRAGAALQGRHNPGLGNAQPHDLPDVRSPEGAQ